MNLSRRGLLGSIICAPAIVRASSLMPVRVWKPEYVEISEIITTNRIYYFAGQRLIYWSALSRPFVWGDTIS